VILQIFIFALTFLNFEKVKNKSRKKSIFFRGPTTHKKIYVFEGDFSIFLPSKIFQKIYFGPKFFILDANKKSVISLSGVKIYRITHIC